MSSPMLEAAVCPLCGQKWCGRPCLRDPRKPAHLFKPDGSERSLKERGLGWDDPPPRLMEQKRRPKPRLVQLKQELAKRGVTEKAPAVPPSVTENRPSVTENRRVTKKGRGRPKSEQALSPAERARKARAKRKGTRMDFKG